MTRKLWSGRFLRCCCRLRRLWPRHQQLPPALKVKSSRYMGAHPIATVVNGYCQIDVPHTHDYAPDKPNLYQRVGDDYVFAGDPVPFGYDGQKERILRSSSGPSAQ